ncbi:Lipoxygenase 4 [Hibiscus syriacus]|uniref:Lipoxygenase n=1 Tax=Hibiscus syriacus TaxID=106335 RepID=A0A6A2WFS2_HIBSY|nr:Lipoxygenase 4 [Hibiscus syriacus]
MASNESVSTINLSTPKDLAKVSPFVIPMISASKLDAHPILHAKPLIHSPSSSPPDAALPVLGSHAPSNQNRFLVNPVLLPSKQRSLYLRRAATVPVVAAVSDNLIKAAPDQNDKGVQFKVRAAVTVRNKNKEDLKETLMKHLDAFTDKIGRNVVLELISTEEDPKTKAAKKSKGAVLKDWSKKAKVKAERVHYTAEFTVASNFGLPGAISVTNKHQEFFLESITVEGFACGPLHFLVTLGFNPTEIIPVKGFSSLTSLIYRVRHPRVLEHSEKGAEGYQGQWQRDLYLVVKKFLTQDDRTGRLPTETDIQAESRVEKPLPIYVPRDEQFEESKQNAFSAGRLRAVLHNLLPQLKASISAYNRDINSFSDIDDLYKEGLLLKLGLQDEAVKSLPLPKVVTKIQESSQGLLKYETPKVVSKDKFAWLRDDEFARQVLAGVNPVNIERMTVFPPVSKQDPEIYGPLESALKEEHIASQLNGMTVQQALEENKLFMVDYHDLYLPFLDRINALDGRKSYATRTIFFLTRIGTLKPIAIELSLPHTAPCSRSKSVVTPPVDATSNWIWQLAKAHVCSNDAGVHQLVNHWLRTHACMEPFILAAHRQLSAMHPIFKLLDPHMRYTLEINALARQSLISADGVIESCFNPGRYCMEMSAAAYRSHWRFDQEGLPADLIRRGIAVPDSTHPHGLKLLIEDYPYASDGLLIWNAIENWVRTYVNRYYPNSSLICNDNELQRWYHESVHVGHADLSNEDWWPTLNTPDDLVSILTTIIWLASAQHAALNFGQYPYGALPSLLQATKFMAVVDTLTHSPDEEYLGERQQPSTWSGDAQIIEAFYRFAAEIQQVEKEIEKRNGDHRLKNRCGAGVLPYELLAPSSEPGVTGRGVPNSVSI